LFEACGRAGLSDDNRLPTQRCVLFYDIQHCFNAFGLVLSTIAQIRTSLDSFAIRGQLLHYRDFMLRELCYDQALFVLQISLVILDPNIVFASILDRFQPLHYCSGAIVHEAYEGPYLSSMVEELFCVLITIVSEEPNATKMPLPAQVTLGDHSRSRHGSLFVHG
jgi:hypothetical protein